MTRSFRHGVFIVLISPTSFAFPQVTFQKLLPDLQPTWGDCSRRSPAGGLTFSSSAQDQFGPSGRDIALLSFNDQGDTLWTKVYGTSFDDGCFHLLATYDGGYLLTGSTGTGGADSSETSVYLIRTDDSGDTLWTRAYGPEGYAMGIRAIQCGDGGFLVVGPWGGVYNEGVYILRIDPAGTLLWTKHYDQLVPPEWESSVSAHGIAETANGDFFVAGDLASYPGVFLARLNPEGEVLWSKATRDIQFIDQIRTMPDGGLVISGLYDQDPMLMRLDAEGAPLWSKAYEGIAVGWGADAFTPTSDNGVALVAQTEDVAPGSSNVYFLRTDSAGEVMFSRSFGDVSWDAGRGVVEADDGGYFIVAFTQSFGYGTAMTVIKTDATGSSGCYEYEDLTAAADVELTWDTLEMQALSSITYQYPSACSIRSGTSVVPLCTVGIDDVIHDESNVQVFPNPATGRFTVVIPTEHSLAEIEVFNTLGDRAMVRWVTSPQATIDCSSLMRGVYLIKVSTGTRTGTHKLVLE